MDDEFNDLQRLLRLKRYEVPPTEYFEDFLFEFHRRQRAELLQRPLWRLALDRLEGALPTFSPARYVYAGSFAVATAVALIASSNILTAQPHRTVGGVQVAQVDTLPTAAQPVAPVVAANHLRRLDLHNARTTVRLPELNFDQQPAQPYTAVSARSARPRYVLDTQPVSYEQPSSF